LRCPCRSPPSATGGRIRRSSFCSSTPTAATSGRFPREPPSLSLSHSQAAEREAKEEAGATGIIEPHHFHIYVHSKGVFWHPGGVQEYVVKAFLMEVRQTRQPEEDDRNPTWFEADRARAVLAKGREVKYAHELQTVIDRAVEHLGVARMAATAR
jgi:8-oxo-dGTP pyrophosphatase MutT (NUDIX family)